MPGVGPGKEIPVLTKIAKLEASLDLGGGVPDVETGNITFDKETDEVVLIYGIDIIPQNLNGMGTGTEVDVIVTRDPDEDALDYDDEDVIAGWHFTKSFVTSGMVMPFPNLKKDFNQPLVTSKPQLRVIGETGVAVWATGKIQCYINYTTRKLDAEAMRILIGGD